MSYASPDREDEDCATGATWGDRSGSVRRVGLIIAGQYADPDRRRAFRRDPQLRRHRRPRAPIQSHPHSYMDAAPD